MNYASDMYDLTPDQRLHFYEVFANYITVVIRSVWSDDAFSCEEKLEQIKWINEILHRIVAKISVMRRKTHEWTEEDFASMIKEYVNQCPKISCSIQWAIQSSLTRARNTNA